MYVILKYILKNRVVFFIFILIFNFLLKTKIKRSGGKYNKAWNWADADKLMKLKGKLGDKLKEKRMAIGVEVWLSNNYSLTINI